MPLSMRRLDGPIGVEFDGVDLSRPLDPATLDAVRDAWNEWSVVVFRGQTLTGAQLIDFTRKFGTPDIHLLNQHLHPDHPEILVISNIEEDGEHIGIHDAGRYWHSDLSYMAEPSRGAVLYAIEIPQSGGQALGDTLWAGAAAAYDALPDSLARQIDGLSASFSLEYHHSRLRADGDETAVLRDDQQVKAPEVVHPVVRTHPVTGRKSIFANEGHTIRICELPEAESADLLARLHRHCTAPEFVYRHCWQAGDVVMWDNVPTQHIAICDYALPRRRLLHRTTLRGAA